MTEEKIPEQTEEEVQRKLLQYANWLHTEDTTKISLLEVEIQKYKDVQKELLIMLAWIKEHFGSVDTSDFGHTNLSDYIDECLEEEKLNIESLK